MSHVDYFLRRVRRFWILYLLCIFLCSSFFFAGTGLILHIPHGYFEKVALLFAVNLLVAAVCFFVSPIKFFGILVIPICLFFGSFFGAWCGAQFRIHTWGALTFIPATVGGALVCLSVGILLTEVVMFQGRAIKTRHTDAHNRLMRIADAISLSLIAVFLLSI